MNVPSPILLIMSKSTFCVNFFLLVPSIDSPPPEIQPSKMQIFANICP